jgi:predicted DNA-binding transcriptional regulator YafY
MRYQQSQKIEQRLQAVLSLIRTGRYSTTALAKEVGVSIPTISRIVAALRGRGYDIRAEHHQNNWRYVLAANPRTSKPRARSTQSRDSSIAIS